MSSTPPIVLAFAASDPTGGAGLQADVLTIAAMGCHPLSVLTALTVQDTRGVESLRAIDSRWVDDQARRLLAEIRVDAFKLGVLGSAQNVAAIASVLADHPEVPVVFDPVLASGRGDVLASDDMIDALREMILPQSTVVTPNSLEARRLAAEPELGACARKILGMGSEYVLITGTHEATDEVVNTLYDAGGVVREDRLKQRNAAFQRETHLLDQLLASGASVPEAVRDAEEFTWQALAAGFAPGAGQFIPNRFFEQ